MTNWYGYLSTTMKLVLAVVLATPSQGWGNDDVAAATQFEVTARSGLNVRKLPGARKIGAIPKGTTVYSAGEVRDGWMPVLYVNESQEWVTGYVSKEYTRIQTVSSGNGTQATLNQNSNNLSQQVEGTKLNLSVNVQTRARLRMSPSLSGKIVDRLTNDMNVEVVGKPRGEWIPVKVTATGKLGWVHSTLLEADSKIYGERNPLEVSAGASDKAEIAGAKILASYHTAETEGAILEYCETCARRSGLQQIDTSKITSSGGWSHPLRGRIVKTSSFGPRWGRMHRGQDFSVPVGTSVYAAKGGRVIEATSQRGYGRIVTIQHENGYTSSYAHLSAVNVRVGQNVVAGQRIAASGNTGRTTGPHLHFEVRRNGTAIEPMQFIR